MHEIKSITILDVDDMSISISEKKAIYQVRIPSKWFKEHFRDMKRAKILLVELNSEKKAVLVIPY